MAAESSAALGLATPMPAMSLATCRAPCSKTATVSPTFTPGNSPGPPVSPATCAHAAAASRQLQCGREGAARCSRPSRRTQTPFTLQGQECTDWGRSSRGQQAC